MKASMEPPSPTRSQFFADHEGSARKQLNLITFGLALATFSLALAMLSGCAPYSGTMAAESREQLSFVDLMDKSDLAPRAGVGSESQAKAAEAVRFITQDDLPRASHTINAALQLDERGNFEVAKQMRGTLRAQHADSALIRTRCVPRGHVARREVGGRGGIRTHEARERLPVFKTGAFNRSATLPS